MSRVQPKLLDILADWQDPERIAGEGAAVEVLELAERLLAEPAGAGRESGTWHRYLDLTRHPAFLEDLPDAAARLRWAETTFQAIERSGFTLLKMLEQRVARHPGRILFQELDPAGTSDWSYDRIARRLQAIAAVFWDGTRAPRVAIWSENCLGGACTDLACLCHDILVTPLNVHFDVETVAWACRKVGANILVTDTRTRLGQLLDHLEKFPAGMRLFLLQPDRARLPAQVQFLDAACADLSAQEITRRLARRPRRPLREVATVMFTSGSTGMPKGVAFTLYNLVTKRFARGAALPTVGRDEVMLCYLPLFHTFGRYLELLGSIYWGGTYVFSGNPSSETLLAQFGQVRPTALISIPLRWVQIRDACLERIDEGAPPERQQETVREVVGDRLRWGLSAAGYLDPRVFRFFHRHGVQLCSGFGMTEATGGITMTPPGDYQEDSVGIPLPGVRVRMSEEGELQISGPYIARYLAGGDEPPPDGTLATDPPPEVTEADHWLATGDLFLRRDDGHLQIVDRIKDIYKNDRGQTIAPRRVESRFTDVPGIKRTFLVGDGLSYNTLLIVPERSDPVLESLSTADETWDYFHQIVSTANRDLASFERVVSFAIVDRDFELERGELTPKGSYRRKVIAENFKEDIAGLYQSREVVLPWAGFRIHVPHWLFRDLGILLDDIEVRDGALVNAQSGQRLALGRHAESGRVRVGDLEYTVRGEDLDLGLFARQPLLWAGNPQLSAFCPTKTGWDTQLGPVSEQVVLPPREGEAERTPLLKSVAEPGLATVDQLCQEALFGPTEAALDAVLELETRLGLVDDRLGNLIRRRLEALAYHPDQALRCRAYHILVLDEPVPDYNKYLPTFIQSGRTFLNEDSIASIARSRIEPRRLQAFRQRLHSYRTQLSWPATPQIRQVFDDLFRLLANFARYHPEYYASVREELVGWILLDRDPELARRAEHHFHQLAAWFESSLATTIASDGADAWEERLVFQDGLSAHEVDRLREVFIGTTFLKESIMLVFEGETLYLQEVEPGGIWISRILALNEYTRYRVSVNTRSGKHYDLQLILRDDIDEKQVLETIFWNIAIRGFPHGSPVLPRFGCCRPELGAISLGYSSDLTLWERVREFSSMRGPGTSLPTQAAWRKMFVLAMATFISGWESSGRRIVPGAVSPTNVVVPEPDFREGQHIISLTGWKPYLGPHSLIRPLLRNFYQQTIAHYPWCRTYLDRAWVFDACVEALGVRRGRAFLEEFRAQFDPADLPAAGAGLAEVLDRYLARLEERYYQPLPLQGAIERFQAWQRVSGQATAGARVETIEELARLYRLDRYPEICRYTLFRQTFFAKAAPKTQDVFDRLLVRMFHQPDLRATAMVELSDLQDTLTSDGDRRAFRRLAFPRSETARQIEVLTVGDRSHEHVIVRTEVVDKRGVAYTVREPTEPAEVGQLYRLFLQAGFPKTISEQDRFYVATDADEQIIGGICYKLLPEGMVHLDGIVVKRSLHDRGITSVLLEDFCARMADLGRLAVKTHFFLRSFYQKRGFRTDHRWGGLVRFLRQV